MIFAHIIPPADTEHAAEALKVEAGLHTVTLKQDGQAILLANRSETAEVIDTLRRALAAQLRAEQKARGE